MLSKKNLNLPSNGKLERIDLFFWKKSFKEIMNNKKLDKNTKVKIGK
jgi:hypothetical protein